MKDDKEDTRAFGSELIARLARMDSESRADLFYQIKQDAMQSQDYTGLLEAIAVLLKDEWLQTNSPEVMEGFKELRKQAFEVIGFIVGDEVRRNGGFADLR